MLQHLSSPHISAPAFIVTDSRIAPQQLDYPVSPESHVRDITSLLHFNVQCWLDALYQWMPSHTVTHRSDNTDLFVAASYAEEPSFSTNRFVETWRLILTPMLYNFPDGCNARGLVSCAGS